MSVSPDELAANFDPARPEPESEIETLATMAAEYGYRLVPIEAEDASTGIVPSANPDTAEDMVRRLTWLTAAQKAASAMEKAYKAEKKQVSEAITEAWSEVGRSSDTIDGYTAYFAPVFAYSHIDPDSSAADFNDALRESGLGYVIKDQVSYMQVLAALKVMDQQKMPIPPKLAALIKFTKGYEVRVTPAGNKKAGPVALRMA